MHLDCKQRSKILFYYLNMVTSSAGIRKMFSQLFSVSMLSRKYFHRLIAYTPSPHIIHEYVSFHRKTIWNSANRRCCSPNSPTRKNLGLHSKWATLTNGSASNGNKFLLPLLHEPFASQRKAIVRRREGNIFQRTTNTLHSNQAIMANTSRSTLCTVVRRT